MQLDSEALSRGQVPSLTCLCCFFLSTSRLVYSEMWFLLLVESASTSRRETASPFPPQSPRSKEGLPVGQDQVGCWEEVLQNGPWVSPTQVRCSRQINPPWSERSALEGHSACRQSARSQRGRASSRALCRALPGLPAF